VHHEQQHQDLILTDLLLAFARNPVAPPTMHPGVRPCAPSPANLLICRRASPHRLRGRRLPL
jgi:hypothetical protein